MQGARIVVWECEGRPFDAVGYGLRLQRRLNDAGFSTEVVRYPLGQGDAAEIALDDDCRCHIWTGGSIPVSEPAMTPWRRLLARQLARSASGGPMVLGICLGSQLMAAAHAEAHAEALRAPRAVRAAPQGMEIGMRRVEAVGAEARAMLYGAHHIDVCQFHYEEIDPAFLDLGAVHHLFRNRHSAVQGFRIGERAFGFQFHPEFSVDDCRRILQDNREEILRWGGTVDPPQAATPGMGSGMGSGIGSGPRDPFDALVVASLRRTS